MRQKYDQADLQEKDYLMVHESSFYIPSQNVERETTEEDKKGEAQQKVHLQCTNLFKLRQHFLGW